MILKETLLEIIQSQRSYLPQPHSFTARDLLPQINPASKQAVIISGIRRCGKSTLLQLLMQKVGSFHYFNFEDSRATNFEASDFDKLFEIQNNITPNCNNYFFDEIQNIPDWERFIRTLLDRNKRVFITGSNASLLSSELGTKLTGRHLRYELFPFSYKEMLEHENLSPTYQSFEKYINSGGFPEFIRGNDIKILQELFKDILYRDIFVRHSIRNTQVLKNLSLFLISNVGKEFSYNKLKNHFELGSVNSVISFLEFLEDCYLLFTIPKFDYSYKKQIISPKKIYAIDSGLIRSNTVSFSSDLGRILENIVFLELKRKKSEIFYYREKNECDFVIKTNGKITEAYQVCMKLTEDNMKREVSGIVSAVKKFNLPKGVILTANQDDNLLIDGNQIEIIPVWKWMTNKQIN